MNRAPRMLVSRYARALFQAAVDRQDLPQVRADLEGISDAMLDYPELPLLLGNPRLSRAKVRGILNGLADRLKAGQLTRRFVALLVDHDRIEVLSDIREHFEQLWRDYHAEVQVTVTTAVPVSDALQRTIRDHLAKKSGRKPLVVWDVNPALLGGIVIAWPDHVYDGSLARKLQHLRDRLALGA